MLQNCPPRWLDADRIASLALYRALVSQASALTSVSPHHRSELHNLIRRRFRRARGIANPAKRRLYFSAGYEALDYLDAAVAGSASHTTAVLNLLARAPAHARAADPVPSRTREGPFPKPSARETGRISLLDRPLPLSALSGPRHVPVLFNASGIPVLRVKKPQPESLTSYIVGRLRQRQERYDRRARLLEAKVTAEAEDAWDEILRREGVGARTSPDDVGAGGQARGEGEAYWVAEVNAAIAEVSEALAREREKNMEMATRMQAVVDRERELWEKETAAAAAAAAAAAKG